MTEPNRYFHRVLKRLESKISRFQDTVQLKKSKLKSIKKTCSNSEEATDDKNLKISIKFIKPESASPISHKRSPKHFNLQTSPKYPLIINPETFHKQFKVRRKSLLRRSHTPSNISKSKDDFFHLGIIFQTSPKHL